VSAVALGTVKKRIPGRTAEAISASALSMPALGVGVSLALPIGVI
jgi:hypothetical protein